MSPLRQRAACISGVRYLYAGRGTVKQRSEKKMLSALHSYYAQVRGPERFAHCKCGSEYAEQIRQGNYVFPRKEKTDTAAFRQRFGYEMPEILQAYFSVYHPEVSGFHPHSPYCHDAIILHSSFSQGLQDILHDAALWRDTYHAIDMEQYIPIGCISYFGSLVLMERMTGHIYVEDDDNKDGVVYPGPLAEDLITFIQDMRVYPEWKIARFLRKDKRERFLYEIRGKKRKTGIGRFCHDAAAMLDPSAIVACGRSSEEEIVQTVQQYDPFAMQHLNWYIMACAKELDGKLCSFRDALSMVLGNGMAAVIISEHTAIVETEQEQGTPVRYILHDTKKE